MSATVLLSLLGVGTLVGLASGLLGIGGGVLIVPFLYFFYAHPEWSGSVVPAALQAVVAHATSLAIILPTAVRGTLDQHRAGLVVWRAALPIGIASTVAAVAGASIADELPAPALKLAFGFVLVAAALNMVRPRPEVAEHEERLELWRTIPTGVAVGLFSAIMGVGGGILAIPLLIYVIGVRLRAVAATSLAIICLAAVAGVTTYVAEGLGTPGLPPYSIGYVHLLAAVPILLASVLAVRAGAALNRRLDARALRWAFALLFLAIGMRLVWQNAGALA